MTAPHVLDAMTAMDERTLSPGDSLMAAVADSDQPFVIRGLASDWALVRRAGVSDDAVLEYLGGFAMDVPVLACMGEHADQGRVFYNEDLSGMNFKEVETRMQAVLDKLAEIMGEAHPPTVYLGSTEVDYCLPGMAADNALDLAGVRATVRLWLSNRHRVAAHYDVLENIAITCAGRRRFILFPPEQLENLYVGPIEFTPAGQPVSMVDFENPDFERFPRFAEAIKHARVAEMEPGDGIYIPSMWWHHVEGLARLNILVNHWWVPVPMYFGAPMDALMHAILSIRDLPESQREAWRAFFDHYIFRPGPKTADHLPVDRRGMLDPLTENAARRIRMLLRNKLNK